MRAVADNLAGLSGAAKLALWATLLVLVGSGLVHLKCAVNACPAGLRPLISRGMDRSYLLWGARPPRSRSRDGDPRLHETAVDAAAKKLQRAGRCCNSRLKDLGRASAAMVAALIMP